MFIIFYIECKILDDSILFESLWYLVGSANAADLLVKQDMYRNGRFVGIWFFFN